MLIGGLTWEPLHHGFLGSFRYQLRLAIHSIVAQLSFVIPAMTSVSLLILYRMEKLLRISASLRVAETRQHRDGHW